MVNCHHLPPEEQNCGGSETTKKQNNVDGIWLSLDIQEWSLTGDISASMALGSNGFALLAMPPFNFMAFQPWNNMYGDNQHMETYQKHMKT